MVYDVVRHLEAVLVGDGHKKARKVTKIQMKRGTHVNEIDRFDLLCILSLFVAIKSFNG